MISFPLESWPAARALGTQKLINWIRMHWKLVKLILQSSLVTLKNSLDRHWITGFFFFPINYYRFPSSNFSLPWKWISISISNSWRIVSIDCAMVKWRKVQLTEWKLLEFSILALIAKKLHFSSIFIFIEVRPSSCGSFLFSLRRESFIWWNTNTQHRVLKKKRMKGNTEMHEDENSSGLSILYTDNKFEQ